MNGIVIFSRFIGLGWLTWILSKEPECDHSERIYYDAAGDELLSDLSEACFCKCMKCGQVNLIPSGFQSDTHFEHYLHESEQGGSQALKTKIRND